MSAPFTPEQEARVRLLVATTALDALDFWHRTQRDTLHDAMQAALDHYGVDVLLREAGDA